MPGEWFSNVPTTGALCAGLRWATGVAAMTTRDQVTLTEWNAALEEADVPSEILYAIGLQESGTTLGGQRNYAPWPWVLNVNNEGRYFKSKEDARAALAREVERGNRNVAVGMLQIHLRYNGYRVDNPLTLLEPAVNLRVAAEVLRECGKSYRDTFSKVACYYSGDVDAAGHGYAAQVFRRAGLRGTAVTTVRRDASTWRRPPSLWAAASAPLVSDDDIAFLKSLRRTTDPEPRVIVLDGLTP
jgi:hypothetical protein